MTKENEEELENKTKAALQTERAKKWCHKRLIEQTDRLINSR